MDGRNEFSSQCDECANLLGTIGTPGAVVSPAANELIQSAQRRFINTARRPATTSVRRSQGPLLGRSREKADTTEVVRVQMLMGAGATLPDFPSPSSLDELSLPSYLSFVSYSPLPVLVTFFFEVCCIFGQVVTVCKGVHCERFRSILDLTRKPLPGSLRRSGRISKQIKVYHRKT